jgi:hypothetical protein
MVPAQDHGAETIPPQSAIKGMNGNLQRLFIEQQKIMQKETLKWK